jgi:hypothetical protein
MTVASFPRHIVACIATVTSLVMSPERLPTMAAYRILVRLLFNVNVYETVGFPVEDAAADIGEFSG